MRLNKVNIFLVLLLSYFGLSHLDLLNEFSASIFLKTKLAINLNFEILWSEVHKDDWQNSQCVYKYLKSRCADQGKTCESLE